MKNTMESKIIKPIKLTKISTFNKKRAVKFSKKILNCIKKDVKYVVIRKKMFSKERIYNIKLKNHLELLRKIEVPTPELKNIFDSIVYGSRCSK